MNEVKINNNLFNVITVLTDKDIQEGMMGKKFSDQFDGLLFFMNQGPHSFWMKNCLVPLDMVFMDNGNITKIHHYCEPCDSDYCQKYEGYGDMVLEFLGGFCKENDINEGDQIQFC